MKPTKLLILVLLISSFFSCTKEVKNDFLQNVTIKNKGLSCDGIKMTNYEGKFTETTVSYGEKITFLYENFKGFTVQDSLVYPSMDLYMLSKSGDTVLSKTDLLSKGGILEKDLKLLSEVVFARPVLPNNEYIISVNISDKKSDAYYQWEKQFSIISDPKIKTKNRGLSAEIQYLYSQRRDIAVTGNTVPLYEKTFLIFENLEGFTADEEGNVSVLAAISLTDANNMLIHENDNLLPQAVSAKDLKERLYAIIEILEDEAKNPITCTFELKDAKSGKSLYTTVELNVKK